jgi:hypothetical protein
MIYYKKVFGPFQIKDKENYLDGPDALYWLP